MSITKRTRPRVKIAPGLWENQNASGPVSYTSTVHVDGKPITKTLRDMNRTEAKKKHLAHENEVKNEGKRPSRNDMTFAELRDEAFEEIEKAIVRDGAEAAGMSLRTLNNYRIALRRLPENDVLFGTKLSKIADEVFMTRLAKRLRALHKSDENPKGYEWKTVHETKTAIQRIFAYGREEGHMRGLDPFLLVPKKFGIPQRVNEENIREALAPSAVRRIIRAAQSQEFVEATDTLMSNLVIQAFCEGERIGETRHTRWRDVDTVFGILTTRGTKNLRSKKRPQAAQPPTVEAWHRQLEHEVAKGYGRPDDYVFTQADFSGDPITHDQARVAVERAGKLAGLGHVTPMNGRHSTVTADRLSGVDEKRSAAKHGHAVEVADQHYFQPPADIEALSLDRDKRAAYFNWDADKAETDETCTETCTEGSDEEAQARNPHE